MGRGRQSGQGKFGKQGESRRSGWCGNGITASAAQMDKERRMAGEAHASGNVVYGRLLRGVHGSDGVGRAAEVEVVGTDGAFEFGRCECADVRRNAFNRITRKKLFNHVFM